MVKSVEGVLRGGKVELLAPAPAGAGPRVIVTFMSRGGAVDLSEYGISPEQAIDLRARLKTFADDWNRPEMDVYDFV